jgi:phosphoserine phosphatase RsbU/P
LRGARARGQKSPPNQWAIALGDVSGKGMPAALLMARITTEVRLLVQVDPEPTHVAGLLNRSLCENGAGRFLTFLLTVLDVRRHQLTVVNAGHMGPMIRRAGNRIEVIGQDESGPPLGVVDDQAYQAVTTHIDPGDVVVLFTDGVNEAMSPSGEMFGMRRLEQCVTTASGGAISNG